MSSGDLTGLLFPGPRSNAIMDNSDMLGMLSASCVSMHNLNSSAFLPPLLVVPRGRSPSVNNPNCFSPSAGTANNRRGWYSGPAHSPLACATPRGCADQRSLP
ncbi:hypothetical protein BD779DRAFT_910840 [Infundibulicybe gibba]|nr:hypothetical protein BD779DRAFT_910840 [Infundibulicybe gibba]